MNPRKTRKVLIAEDNALIAMSLREVLSLIGLEVVGVAASVNEAVCLAQNTRPDLVIFDVRLTGKRDGVEGAALLREIMEVAVIFLTATGDQETRARAQVVYPAASYLSKPVSSQQLVAAVESALMQRDVGLKTAKDVEEK